MNLKLEEVSCVAKRGPRAGRTGSYARRITIPGRSSSGSAASRTGRSREGVLRRGLRETTGGGHAVITVETFAPLVARLVERSTILKHTPREIYDLHVDVTAADSGEPFPGP